MATDDMLKEYRRRLPKSREWFSNARKRDREAWVCLQFLKNLGLPVTAAQLVPVEDVAPDVLFDQARFEVKELLDEGRRRTDEYREAIRRAEQADTYAEVWKHITLQDLTPEMIVSDIHAKIPDWVVQYEPSFRRSLDLLVYHNRTGLAFQESIPSSTEAFGSYGFRSVSVMADSLAWVLWAGPSTPAFLASKTGSICSSGSRSP